MRKFVKKLPCRQKFMLNVPIYGNEINNSRSVIKSRFDYVQNVFLLATTTNSMLVVQDPSQF
jgi:hypothetical protein